MKTAALAAVIVLCLTIAFAVGFVTPHVTGALDAVAAIGRLEPQAAAALASVQGIETNTTRTEAELAGLLNETRHIAIDERKVQAAQMAQVADIGNRIDGLVADADSTVRSLGDLSPVVERGIDSSVADFHSSMVSSQAVLTAATADLTDPAIRDSEADIAAAARNLAVTSQQAAATMTDVRVAVDHETKIIMAPVSKVKAAAGFVVWLAGRFY